MERGELRKFFSRVPSDQLCDKLFLVVDNHGSAVDIMVDGELRKDVSSLFISSFSEVVSEVQ